MQNDVILEISNLHAGVENKKILKGVNLTIRAGEGSLTRLVGRR